MIKRNLVLRTYLSSLMLVVAESAAGLPTVEVLKKPELQSLCGCSFQIPGTGLGNENTILQWSYGDDAFMRVNGRLERLAVKLSSQKLIRRDQISVGDREVYELTNRRIRVIARCKTIAICDPKISECETYGIDAEVSVSSSKGTRTFNVEGACGC